MDRPRRKTGAEMLEETGHTVPFESLSDVSANFWICMAERDYSSRMSEYADQLERELGGLRTSLREACNVPIDDPFGPLRFILRPSAEGAPEESTND